MYLEIVKKKTFQLFQMVARIPIVVSSRIENADVGIQHHGSLDVQADGDRKGASVSGLQEGRRSSNS